MSEIAAKLGKGKKIQISKDSLNFHMLVTGQSGSGKTYALQMLEKSLAVQGGYILVLDFAQTHSEIGHECVRYIDAKKSGIPLTFLSPVKKPDGTFQDAKDVVEDIIDMFSAVKRLGVRQKALFRKILAGAIDSFPRGMNECSFLWKALQEFIIINEGKDLAAEGERIMDLYGDFLETVNFRPTQRIIEAGKITVLDLSGFPHSIQTVLAETIMAILWRIFRIKGRYASSSLYVVCDECQLLNLRDGSIMSQILREGRKFNFSLLLSTQTLTTFSKQEQAILQQTGTNLYFKPSPHEIRQIAKWIDLDNQKQVEKMLRTLSVGKCIATGKFQVGGVTVERPLTIEF